MRKPAPPPYSVWDWSWDLRTESLRFKGIAGGCMTEDNSLIFEELHDVFAHWRKWSLCPLPPHVRNSLGSRKRIEGDLVVMPLRQKFWPIMTWICRFYTKITTKTCFISNLIAQHLWSLLTWYFYWTLLIKQLSNFYILLKELWLCGYLEKHKTQLLTKACKFYKHTSFITSITSISQQYSNG